MFSRVFFVFSILSEENIILSYFHDIEYLEVQCCQLGELELISELDYLECSPRSEKWDQHIVEDDKVQCDLPGGQVVTVGRRDVLCVASGLTQ